MTVTPENSSVRTGIDPADPATILLVDLDGTITDSFAGIANSFRHALDVAGAPAPSDDLVAGIVGPPMMDTLQSIGLDATTADSAMRAYRQRYTDIGWQENEVFDGMARLLADLATAGRTLALATSKDQTTAARILDHFGLAGHFRVIAGAGDGGRRRSKADVIEHALDGLGIDPTTVADDAGPAVVMVGDRAHDIEGAAAFRIPAILVGWGYALRGEDPAAAWHVDSVHDLREVLGV